MTTFEEWFYQHALGGYCPTLPAELDEHPKEELRVAFEAGRKDANRELTAALTECVAWMNGPAVLWQPSCQASHDAALALAHAALEGSPHA